MVGLECIILHNTNNRMSNKIIFIVLLTIFFSSCKRESNDDSQSLDINKEKEIEKNLIIEIKKETDFFKILAQYLETDFDLVEIRLDKYDKTINDFLKKETNVTREARFKNIKNNDLLYIKELIFHDPAFILEIKNKLKKGIYREYVEIEGTNHEVVGYYIKGPNTFYQAEDLKLYIFYVKSEYNRNFINKVEKVLENKDFLKEVKK